MLADSRRCRPGVSLESGDGLFLAILEDVEILRLQAMDGLIFLAGYHGIHQHQARFGLELQVGRTRGAGSAGLRQ